MEAVASAPAITNVTSPFGLSCGEDLLHFLRCPAVILLELFGHFTGDADPAFWSHHIDNLCEGLAQSVGAFVSDDGFAASGQITQKLLQCLGLARQKAKVEKAIAL